MPCFFSDFHSVFASIWIDPAWISPRAGAKSGGRLSRSVDLASVCRERLPAPFCHPSAGSQILESWRAWIQASGSDVRTVPDLARTSLSEGFGRVGRWPSFSRSPLDLGSRRRVAPPRPLTWPWNHPRSRYPSLVLGNPDGVLVAAWGSLPVPSADEAGILCGRERWWV